MGCCEDQLLVGRRGSAYEKRRPAAREGKLSIPVFRHRSKADMNREEC